MDHLGALGAFVQSAETRSFTQAGQRLGLSSSAIGKAVARLEEELGVRLFHRSTRSIRLTAEGSLFLQRCYRIIGEFDQARLELTEAVGKPSGKLRIGLPQLGIHLMPHFIAFQQHFPEIELELDFSDRLMNLIDEGFDAVMRIGEVSDSRLTIRKLNGYHHRLVAAPSYLDRNGMPCTPSDLAGHTCLRYRYPTSGKLAPWPLVSDGKAVVVDLPQSATTNTVDSLAVMAEAGLGIAFLPDFLVSASIATGRLAAILDEHVDDHRTFCILWPSSRQSLPRIKAFVDFIAARLVGGFIPATPSQH
jgi:DNA-binding transcriptional LysR family regulator